MFLRASLLWCYLFTLCLSPVLAQQVDTESEKGFIENGYKVGVWEYYDSPHQDKPSLTVDYTKNIVLYLEPDTSQFTLLNDGSWVNEKPDRHPRYLGSNMTLYQTLMFNITYPQQALQERLQDTVYLYFEVDPKGKAGNIKTYSTDCSSCEEEAKRTFDLLPNYWLAAQKNGTNVGSSFLLPFIFKLAEEATTASSTDVLIELPKGKKLSSVVVVGYGAPKAKKIKKKKLK